jgi:hypothetical protein
MEFNNSPKSCQVCGSKAIQHDEVFDTGRLILSECRRCQHRWTRASPIPVASQGIRMRRASATEVAIAS